MSIQASSIDDYAISVLLRHFTGRASISPGSPRIAMDRDLDLLQLHWALSAPLRELINYVLSNLHETQSVLVFRVRTDDALARGRIDAKRTVIHRLRTGMPTAVVSAAPVRSFQNGPNQILAWVLNRAWQLVHRFMNNNSLGPGYQEKADLILNLLCQVRKIEVFRSILPDVSFSQRPTVAAIIAAQRSRQKLYRLACEAYQYFIQIENGNKEAIGSLLRDTLLVPIENWRRFELAVALAIGEALSQELKQKLHLPLLEMRNKSPVLRCDPYAIYWQMLTDRYTVPKLEPSEQMAFQVLNAYGLSPAGDRPDLLVVNEITGEITSVIEVKFHSGDNAEARFREAVYQIIRYSRGYASNPMEIIGRSAIAMNVAVPKLQDPNSQVPFAFSFDDILAGRLGAFINPKWLQ